MTDATASAGAPDQAAFGSGYLSWLQSTFAFSWSDVGDAGETAADLLESSMGAAAKGALQDASRAADLAAKWSQVAERMAAQIEQSPDATTVLKSMARQAADNMSSAKLSEAFAGNAEATASVMKGFGELFAGAGIVVGAVDKASTEGTTAGLIATLAGFAGLLVGLGVTAGLGFTVGPILLAGALGLIVDHWVEAEVSALFKKLGWDKIIDRLDDKLGDLVESLADGLKDNTYRIHYYDPLALDLNGDGLVGTAKEADYRGALFDNDGDGIRTATGWIGPDDGLLVRDLNGNGVIDNGAELFGDQTVVGDHETAANGFAALAVLDANNDGVVDAKDAGFATLRVWKDANGNGATDPGELLSLGDLGIVSLATASSTTSAAAVDGGSLLSAGSFTKTDAAGVATTGVMDDFDLLKDSIHSEYADHIDVPDAIAALPDAKGLGSLRDLREAAALSPALAAALATFAAAATPAEQHQLIDTLLREWAKTSPKFRSDPVYAHNHGAVYDDNSENVIQLEPGEMIVDITDPVSSEVFWQIRVAQMVLGGDPADDIWWSGNNVSQLEKIYGTFAQGVYTSLACQTRLKGYIDSATLQWSDESNGISFDFSSAISQLQSKFASDEVAGAADLLDLLQGVPLFSQNKAAFDALLSVELTKIDKDGLDGALTSLYSDYSGPAGEWTVSPGATDTTGPEFILADGAANALSGGSGSDFVVAAVGDDTVNGNAGDDTLMGGDGNDALHGGDGNDTLIGGSGDDALDGGDNGANVLMGGAGNDVLNPGAHSASNTLAGGAGDDQLYGSYNNDTYLFNVGDGKDTITEAYGTGATDTLKFGAGIAPTDVAIRHSANDLILTFTDSTDQITIKDWFARSWNAPYFIEQFQFADGTVWTPSTIAGIKIDNFATAPGGTLNGWDGTDHLIGTEGDDNLYGYGGSDALIGGAGNDKLYGGLGSDTLDGGVGDDTLDGGGNSGGINDGANQLLGGAGNDVITAGLYAQDNTIEGGTGDDTITGSGYGDTYLFNVGDGKDIVAEQCTWGSDTLKFGAGIAPSDLSATRSGNDLVLALANGNDQITIKNWFATAWNNVAFIEQFQFADGTVWTPDTFAGFEMDLTASDAGDALRGWNGNDRLTGGAGADSLEGYYGNDILIGNAGDDVLDGNRGDDVLLGGDGNDKLYANLGSDKLDGGAGDDTLDGGGNGANVLVGGAGNDVITAGLYAQDNTIEGGTGDDTITGSGYGDTYLFNVGDGKDIVAEQSSWGNDTLKFGQGITDDQLWFTRDGNNLDVQIIGRTDSVAIKDWYLGSTQHVETFATNDGHVLHDTQVDALVSAMAAFAPPTPGQTTLPDSYREQLAPVLAANWN